MSNSNYDFIPIPHDTENQLLFNYKKGIKLVLESALNLKKKLNLSNLAQLNVKCDQVDRFKNCYHNYHKFLNTFT